MHNSHALFLLVIFLCVVLCPMHCVPQDMTIALNYLPLFRSHQDNITSPLSLVPVESGIVSLQHLPENAILCV